MIMIMIVIIVVITLFLKDSLKVVIFVFQDA